MDTNEQPEPGVIKRAPLLEQVHGFHSTADVVRRLREAADFIECGEGDIQKFTQMRTEKALGGRLSRWVLHLTYIDKRPGRYD